MKKLSVLLIMLAIISLLLGCAGAKTAPSIPIIETTTVTTTPAPTASTTAIAPTPATFNISNMSISPAEVDIGGTVYTSIRVTNTGDLAGNYTLTFKVNGVISDTGEVALAEHESVTRKYTTFITGKDAAGTYSVDVNGISGTFTVRATPTPTPIPTPTPSPTPTVITSQADLVSFLSTNFSSLETSLGVTKFTFEVEYNNTIDHPYDYKVMVDYDGSFVYDLIYSNKISTELANKVGDEMRAYQEKIARAVMAKMPNTKLIGSYYAWGYEYPSIKVGRYTITYCSWSNLGSATWQTKYADAKISDFIWTPDSLMWPGQKDGKLGR